MKQDIVISSWNEFNDIVFGNSWNASIERNRTNMIFRGVSDKNYQLLTSLSRACTPKYDLEKNLIRNFSKYASNIIKTMGFWEIVSLAQHHGLPTRLLDWTFSPYVALHFATENIEKYDCDGAIWCVDFVKCHEYLPEKLKNTLYEHDANGFSVDLLNKHVKSFQELKYMELQNAYPDENLGIQYSFIIFFEPPSIDDRIINQFALFSVLSNPEYTISDWLKLHNELYTKIIIPKEKN